MAADAALASAKAKTAAPPCSIQTLDVKCSHGRKVRTPGPGGVLQVVGNNKEHSVEQTRKYGIVSVKGKYTYIGQDDVTAEVLTLGAGLKKTALVKPGEKAKWDPAELPKTYSISTFEADLWPRDAKPDVYEIQGRGCDDRIESVRIESFPSQQYEFEVDVELFRKSIEEVSEDIEKKLKKSFGPVSLKPRVIGPKGNLGIKWGWREDEDWKAFFGVEVKAGLSPSFEFGLDVEYSFAHIYGMAALASVGLDPVTANKFMEVAREHLGDLWLGVGIGFRFSILGHALAKFYPHTSAKFGGADIVPQLEGSVWFVIGARVGGSFWLSAEVKGGIRTGLGIRGAIELKPEGVFFNPKLFWPGVTGFVTIVLKSCKIELKTFNWECNPLGEHTLLERKWKLAGTD